MKTGAKVGIVVAIILVLLMCCCAGSAIGWFFILGPGSYQTTKANTLVAEANKSYKKVVDASVEISDQFNTLESEAGSTTDVKEISKLEDDLLKTESKAQEMLDELSGADIKLGDAKRLRLPDWYVKYLSLLLKRDATASEAMNKAIAGMSEARKMLGSQSSVVDAVNRQIAAQGQVEAAVSKMEAGDFAGAQGDIAAADASLAAAEAGLTSANKTLKSQDIEDLISLNKSFRDLLSLLSQFLTAAAAGDINKMTSLEGQINSSATEIESESDALGISDDSTKWFESVVKKYADEFDVKMKQANDYDAQAEALYKKNAG